MEIGPKCLNAMHAAQHEREQIEDGRNSIAKNAAKQRCWMSMLGSGIEFNSEYLGTRSIFLTKPIEPSLAIVLVRAVRSP